MSRYPRWFFTNAGVIYQILTKDRKQFRVVTWHCSMCSDVSGTYYWGNPQLLSDKDAEDIRERLHQEWHESKVPPANTV